MISFFLSGDGNGLRSRKQETYFQIVNFAVFLSVLIFLESTSRTLPMIEFLFLFFENFSMIGLIMVQVEVDFLMNLFEREIKSQLQKFVR